VSHLVLYGTYARLTFADDYPIGRDPRVVSGLIDLIRAQWGLGSRTFASLILPEADAQRLAWFTAYQRIATSPQVAADLVAANAAMDVRDVLPGIRTPALVLHRREDVLIGFPLGVYLAERLQRATFRELRGEHHVPYFGDTRAVVEAIDTFLRTERDEAGVHRPLSARELDVLRLLAEGSQDREIGERLGISSATVRRHLANIYTKLGVSTRAAAAALAVRQRLV
jgi:DNA-binding NarL/FixJ family response regulator